MYSKMVIAGPTAPCICCHTLWSIIARKQATNDKLQGSLATYLRCGGDVDIQIKKGLLLSLLVKNLKSVIIWHSYQQELGGCLVHVVHMATTLLKDEESARAFLLVTLPNAH